LLTDTSAILIANLGRVTIFGINLIHFIHLPSSSAFPGFCVSSSDVLISLWLSGLDRAVTQRNVF
jgi:hypothetical protein